MRIYLLNLLIPFVMILVAVILKKHPAPDRKAHKGYNTPESRRSKEHWEYAQNIAPGIFFSLGKKLLLTEIFLSLLLSFCGIQEELSVTAGMAAGVFFLCLGFYKTDRKIRENFGTR